ncbi:MAG: NAD(P)-binding protein [Candidatus Woesearchaeota archaeon]
MQKHKRDLFEQKILTRVAIALWAIIFLVLLTATLYTTTGIGFREAIYEATTLITQLYIKEPTHGPLLFLLGFIGKVLVIYVIYILIMLFNEGMFRDAIKEAILMQKVKKFKSHYIISGGGRVGFAVAQMLKQQKKSYIIIEKNPELVLSLREHHQHVIEGDALDEQMLQKVGIKQASVFISTLGNDGDNIMQIILVKKINPTIKIVARANYPQFVETMKKFGAHEVVMPEAIGGERIAQQALALANRG